MSWVATDVEMAMAVNRVAQMDGGIAAMAEETGAMQEEAHQFIAERRHLVDVALGQSPADLVIKGVWLLNTL